MLVNERGSILCSSSKGNERGLANCLIDESESCPTDASCLTGDVSLIEDASSIERASCRTEDANYQTGTEDANCQTEIGNNTCVNESSSNTRPNSQTFRYTLANVNENETRSAR